MPPKLSKGSLKKPTKAKKGSPKATPKRTSEARERDQRSLKTRSKAASKGALPYAGPDLSTTPALRSRNVNGRNALSSIGSYAPAPAQAPVIVVVNADGRTTGNPAANAHPGVLQEGFPAFGSELSSRPRNATGVASGQTFSGSPPTPPPAPASDLRSRQGPEVPPQEPFVPTPPSASGASSSRYVPPEDPASGLLAQKRADVIRAKQLFDAMGKKRSTLEEVGIRSELLDILHRNAEADLTTMGTDVEKLADMFLEQAKKGFGWDSVTELLDLPNAPRVPGGPSSTGPFSGVFEALPGKVKTVFDEPNKLAPGLKKRKAERDALKGPAAPAAAKTVLGLDVPGAAVPERARMSTQERRDSVKAYADVRREQAAAKRREDRAKEKKDAATSLLRTSSLRQASKQAALTTRRTWTPEQREAYNSRWSVGPLGTFAKPEPGAFPTFGSEHASGSEHGSRPRNATGVASVHTTGPSKTKKERERLRYAKPLPVIVDPVRQASKQAALTTRRTWTPEQREAYNSRLEATEAQQKARVVQRKTTIDTLTNRLTRLKQRPNLAPVQRATRAVRSDALAAAATSGTSASRRSVRARRNS